MSMTDAEITHDVTKVWAEGNLGLYQKAVSWYLVEMKNDYAKIAVLHFDDEAAVGIIMLRILAYIWGALRWYGGFPVSVRSGYFPPLDGSYTFPSPSPRPLEADIDAYPLDTTGVLWAAIDKQEYNMMVATYINQLSDAWLDDTATLWSTASTTAGQKLFQVCYQYILRYGTANADFEFES
jgi:hypothetical protein